MPRKYWLMKSEPESFSIDDLEAQHISPWDGVRNYQARNFMMREMSIGDQVFFYHSNAKPSGIVGVCVVASKPYPDPTQFDPKSPYYDPRSTAAQPRWYLVDVQYHNRFPIIPLERIKANPRLKDMLLVQKGSRLSIQPLTKQEWDEILKMHNAS